MSAGDIFMIMAVLVGLCLAYGLGFVAGIFHERKEWNKLIEEGRLPKPKTKGDNFNTRSHHPRR